jgi:hypothetical protein
VESNRATTVVGPGRVPYVRPGVHGPKTTGRSPLRTLFLPMYALANMGHPFWEEGVVERSVSLAHNPEKMFRTDLSPL